jgi:aspartate-semialdehyde dehydrogenase
MPAEANPLRVAIAGASSLRGKELKELLEDGSFSAADIRLLDEEIAAGILTEAAGEPALIQSIEEDSFERARFAFFTGTPAFAARHAAAAQRAGSTVIDLSGGLADVADAVRWIPALDASLPPPAAAPQRSAGKVFLSPDAPAIIACSLAAALGKLAVERLAIVFLQSVSERGRAGIEELESQTVKLLAFQPISQEVFDTQVAFNLMDRYGEGSAERLSDARTGIAREVQRYLCGRVAAPAIQLIQAPVFYAHAFAAYAEFPSPPDAGSLRQSVEAAGMRVSAANEAAPTSINVAGESGIMLGQIERDPNVPRGYWLWGAADNLRLATANAVSIAEKLLAADK